MTKHGHKGATGSQYRAPTSLPLMPDPATIVQLPVTTQELEFFLTQYQAVNIYALRAETIKRIEKITGNSLLCYVTQTSFLPNELPRNMSSIEDSDLEGF